MQCLYGQHYIPQKKGEVVIEVIAHNYLKNNSLKVTRKTNRKNKPLAVVYFDKNGNTLESFSYRFAHINDLNMLNYVESYEYNQNNLLISKFEFGNDRDNILNHSYTTDYLYNDDNVIGEYKYSTWSHDTIIKAEFEYNNRGNKSKTIYKPGYYIEQTYTANDKLATVRQIYDNKLQWEYIYTYTDSTRIVNFRTLRNDGKDYERNKTIKHKNGVAIESEDICIGYSGIDEKTKYYYTKIGLLEKVEYYERYMPDQKYNIVSYIDFKTKGYVKDINIITKINTELNLNFCSGY